jgi:hypothetical protein
VNKIAIYSDWEIQFSTRTDLLFKSNGSEKDCSAFGFFDTFTIINKANDNSSLFLAHKNGFELEDGVDICGGNSDKCYSNKITQITRRLKQNQPEETSFCKKPDHAFDTFTQSHFTCTVPGRWCGAVLANQKLPRTTFL